jgi:hypothetical protein
MNGMKKSIMMHRSNDGGGGGVVSGEAGKSSGAAGGRQLHNHGSLDVTTRGVVSTSNYSVVCRQHPEEWQHTETKKKEEGRPWCVPSGIIKRRPLPNGHSFFFFFAALCGRFLFVSLYFVFVLFGWLYISLFSGKEGERGEKKKMEEQSHVCAFGMGM